jgi:putative ABC transport system permease protein
MMLTDHLRGLRHTLGTNRARSALTLLGIVIGTGSIVMLAGLLHGAEQALVRLNQGVSGSDTLRIDRDDPPPKQLDKPRRELSRADGDALDASLLLDDMDVATEITREAVARWGRKEKRVRLVGATPSSGARYRLKVDLGRSIVEEDLRWGKRVAVLGHEIFEELLRRDRDVLGRQISIDGQSWTIVGILADKPTMGHGDGTWMWNRKVLVPQVAFDAVFDPTHPVRSIFMRSTKDGANAGRLAAAGKVAEAILLVRHLGVKNFRPADQSGRKQELLIIGIIEILLLGTALMSMFVGGINIMNIMLVTVTERTREIGVRRALGASPTAILIQFVIEAGMVSLIGGALGVVCGIAFTWGIAATLSRVLGDWGFFVEAWSVALGLGLALVTGIVFGLLPAWRAGRLNPVEALRYE